MNTCTVPVRISSSKLNGLVDQSLPRDFSSRRSENLQQNQLYLSSSCTIGQSYEDLLYKGSTLLCSTQSEPLIRISQMLLFKKTFDGAVVVAQLALR